MGATSIWLPVGTDRWSFYEIKSGLGPRLSIREALGQLLEYAYWGDAVQPAHLIVVGDQPIDPESQAYIGVLAREFRLPIRYRHIGIPDDPYTV